MPLPGLATIPVVNVFSGAVLLVTVALLNLAFQLFALAVDDVKVVVGEFAPLLA